MEENQEKLLEKKKFKQYIITVLIIIAILLCTYVISTGKNIFELYETWKNKDFNTKVIQTINFEADIKASFTLVDNSYIRCSKDGVTNMDENGWNETYTMTSPVMVTKGDIIAVGELKNKSVYVFNQKGKLYNIQVDGTVMQFSVNKLGYLVVLSDESTRYKISLYDNLGNLVLYRYEKDKQVWPIATAISDNGEYMAVSYLDTTETQTEKYTSRVLFYSLNNQNDYTDNIVPGAAIERKNEIVSILEYVNDNKLVAIGSNSVILSDKNCMKIWEKNIENYITSFDMKNGNIILLGLGEAMIGGSEYTNNSLVCFDLSGNLLTSIQFESKIEQIVSQKERITVYSARELYGYDTSGNLLWERPIIQDLSQVLMFKDLSKIFVVYKNMAEIIEIK